MGALLAFVPFVVFALIERSMGPVPGLAAGAVASFALLLRDRMRGEREPNILEAGSAVMFSGLTALALIGDATAWSLWRVRLWVDLGLLLIVLFSIAIRRPFTLHHARRRVSPEVARSAAFLRFNDLLSGAWGAAFAVLAAADALMVLRPQTPILAAVGPSLAALAAAAAYTARTARARAARAAGTATDPSRKSAARAGGA